MGFEGVVEVVGHGVEGEGGRGSGEEYDMPSQWFVIVAFLRMTLKPWRERNRGTAKSKKLTDQSRGNDPPERPPKRQPLRTPRAPRKYGEI
ncbi:MAG: hypothetical protein C0485_16990 [Pirellula sp.]|nr:hypothetical protein [Pirellula sp.]